MLFAGLTLWLRLMRCLVCGRGLLGGGAPPSVALRHLPPQAGGENSELRDVSSRGGNFSCCLWSVYCVWGEGDVDFLGEAAEVAVFDCQA